MTFFLPLDPVTQVPTQPSFVQQSSNVPAHTAKVLQAIMKAKRIVVVCGAGISVRAGIPDFRSSEGLFQSIKRDNPKEAMSSGKELFDVSVFNSENKTSLFCQMIAQLSDLSQAAEPTAFHNLLRALDNRGRLLRVYTQNIDAIEEKCGLSFGVPEFEGRKSKAKLRDKAKASMDDASANNSVSGSADSDAPLGQLSSQRVASTSRLPSPPAEMPRCIPLHGTLQSMHCQVCNHSFPLLEHLPALASGQPPSCPECINLEAARQLGGKRPRGIGKLRPSVVLYNEAHKDGEGVGEVVQKDLIGSSKGKGKSGADLLLVVGTSLKVPGTKRIVREFAKAVKSRGVGSSSSTAREESAGSGGSTPNLRSSTGLSTPAPSPRRSPVTTSGAEEETIPAPKAVYLNLDFPVPTREWEGVFDVWMQGDAQQFAEMLQTEIVKEAKAKDIASEKKRKREEEAAATAKDELPNIVTRRDEKALEEEAHLEKAKQKQIKNSKTKTSASGANLHGQLDPSAKPSKKRRTAVIRPPSPPYTPYPMRVSHSPDIMDEDDLDSLPNQEASKLYVRIPPRHHRPYNVPEVLITTSVPQYVMSYELYHQRHRSASPHRTSPSRFSSGHNQHQQRPEQHQLPPGHCSHYSTIRTASPNPPEPPSPPTSQLNKRTKAGRKALREAQEARRAERLVREVKVHQLPPPPPPNRSYLPLRHYHQESFIRSSAPMYHHRTFPREEDRDFDIDIETIDNSFGVDILRRTSRLGLCESS
ncbi:DHS-like NAD/FAD-binding domain-containing protein [Crepidotus variabilis]|uniref:DHS-like NAD/FAD-binding domain-containing protein n=1 Tax=Crepidotus variabilis TaxID=179855 RepID=A0A9P6EQX4_9AGAR|nr:DHS-like NAD/FAD-binding domain-containing protein [Crepidotus variabilis]